MQHHATTNWLKIATGVVIISGVLCLSGAVAATAGLARYLMVLVFWPVDGTPGAVMPQARLLWAILGGVMVGWGVLMWQVITHVYTENPALGRSMILTSVGIWFVLDSSGSIAAGAPLNALFNVIFLALYVVPLWRPVRDIPNSA